MKDKQACVNTPRIAIHTIDASDWITCTRFTSISVGRSNVPEPERQEVSTAWCIWTNQNIPILARVTLASHDIALADAIAGRDCACEHTTQCVSMSVKTAEWSDLIGQQEHDKLD